MPEYPRSGDNDVSLLKKLVTNTAELVFGTAPPYPEVASYGDLSDPSGGQTDKIIVVRYGSGIPFINRTPAGFYQSDGVEWTLLADLPDNYFTDYVPVTRTINGQPLSSDITIPTGGIPAGIICMWGGLVADIPVGWNLCDGTNGTPDLRSRFIKGAAPAQEPGGTGGSETHTPTGTVSQPTFTGDSNTTSADSAGTPAGSVTAPAFTGSSVATDLVSGGTPAGTLDAVSAGTPAGTNGAVTAGTPAGTLDSVSGGTPAGTNNAPALTMNSYTPAGTNANESAHTHSVTAAGTNANESSHTHGVGTFATSGDAATAATGSSGAAKPTANHVHTITGSSAAGSAHTHTFTGSGVTSAAGSAHTHTFTGNAATLTGSIAAPVFTGSALAGHTHTFTGSALGTHNHTFTGTALGTHSHTFSGSALATHAHNVTAAGTNSAPSFTGDSLASHDHTVTPTGNVSQPSFTGDDANYEPEYYALAFIQKT